MPDRLIVYGCEVHIFRAIERSVARNGLTACHVLAADDLEKAILDHQPTYIIAESDEHRVIAEGVAGGLGISPQIEVFRPQKG